MRDTTHLSRHSKDSEVVRRRGVGSNAVELGQYSVKFTFSRTHWSLTQSLALTSANSCQPVVTHQLVSPREVGQRNSPRVELTQSPTTNLGSLVKTTRPTPPDLEYAISTYEEVYSHDLAHLMTSPI